MWPAKLPGEGARMYDACSAMSDVMKQLGIAVDGGRARVSANHITIYVYKERNNNDYR